MSTAFASHRRRNLLRKTQPGGAMRFLALTLTLVIAATSPLWDTRTATGAQPLDGKAIFRFDTFGDEQLWTDVLRMHEVIATVSPATALAVGLKVDVEALPPEVRGALQAGQVDLKDPAVTIQLLKLDA